MFGLRFAYNVYKHDEDLDELREEHMHKTLLFDIDEYIWKEFIYSRRNTPPGYAEYKNVVEGDVVIGTLGFTSRFLSRKIIEILGDSRN